MSGIARQAQRRLAIRASGTLRIAFSTISLPVVAKALLASTERRIVVAKIPLTLQTVRRVCHTRETIVLTLIADGIPGIEIARQTRAHRKIVVSKSLIKIASETVA